MGTLTLRNVSPRVEAMREAAAQRKAELEKQQRLQAQRRQEKLARKARRQRNRIAKRWLVETFPDLFTKPVPLAIGTGRALLVRVPDGLSRVAVRRVLGWWVTSKPYQEALAAGGPRYGLNGPDGEISEAQMAYARRQLEGMG